MASIVDRFIHKYGRLPTEFDPDYWEMLRMTKYNIEPVPYYKPSKCANCGGTKQDGRGYVNFGLEIDWYGIVYICTLCLHDVALNVGLYAGFQKKIDELEAIIAQHNALEGKGAELQSTILHTFEEVKEYFTELYPASTDSTSNSSIVVDPDPPATESGSDVSKEAEPRVTKSTSVSGSKDFPSLAKLLEDNG